MEEILKSLQGKSMTKKNLFDFLSEINLEDISSVKPTNTIVYDDIIIYPMEHELIEEQPKEKKRRGRKPKEKPLVEEQSKEKKRRGRKPKEKPLIEEQPKEKKRRGRKPKEKPLIEEPLKEKSIIEEQPKEKKRRGRKPKEKPLIEEPPKEKKRRGRKPKEKPLIEEKPKENVLPLELKCHACMKIFAKESYLKHHREKHIVCNNWIQLSEKSNLIKLKKGIHLIIDDLLNKTISDNGTLECKFCKYKFSNKGNHHKHYNYSTVCNSMAYDEFKKHINNFM